MWCKAALTTNAICAVFILLQCILSISASDTKSPSNHCLSQTLLLSTNLACSRSGQELTWKIQRQTNWTSSNADKEHADKSYAPWSHPPACTKILPELGNKLCIYTVQRFSNGRGISIFTTPRIAADFLSLPAFRDPASLVGVNGDDGPWYVKPIPGKGNGMFANKSLKRGDRITGHTPALLVHKDTTLSIQEREHYWRLAVNQLPPATRDLYLSLATIYGDPRVIAQDVIEANAFEMDVGGVMHMAVFPETSRINHDCSPNSQYYLDSRTLTHHVHATRSIAQGEEITISYTLPLIHTARRQQTLQTAFHFTCTCRRCQSPRSSDAFLEEVNALQATLNNWEPGSTATPKTARKLIQLLEKDNLEGWLDIGYGHAALAYSAIGEGEKARRFARLAEEALVWKEGPHARDLGMWRELRDRPEGHWSWRWRVRVG